MLCRVNNTGKKNGIAILFLINRDLCIESKTRLSLELGQNVKPQIRTLLPLYAFTIFYFDSKL